ncbi:hypothetical protein BST61_g3927 [Cercospora zeina]
MGRYSFAAQNVHKTASQLLHANRIPAPPPCLATIECTQQKYHEDELRWEYFNDHPWELARPRVVLEDNGRDREVYDWSIPLDYSLRRPRIGTRDETGRTVAQWEEVMKVQGSRPINGEAVVQRWQWLITHTTHSDAAAYDMARKELYRYRHHREVEARVAREEAQATGAYFGLGPLEVGDLLEDQAFENWKQWAVKQTQALRALQGSAYSGAEDDAEVQLQAPEDDAALQEVSSSVPSSKDGQTARGGAPVRP